MVKVKKLMLSVASKASVFGGVFGSVLFGVTSPVKADYTFLPDYINEILDQVMPEGGAGPQHYVNDRVKAGLTILFVAVFIVAIIYSALAAIKFISSQGDASKLEESKAAIKAILMGFAAMLIAIIGLLIVLWVMGSTTRPNETIPITQPTPA